jgi:hypothetical protein
LEKVPPYFSSWSTEFWVSDSVVIDSKSIEEAEFISVLNNGPKIVTRRPTQTYPVSSSLSGRRALSMYCVLEKVPPYFSSWSTEFWVSDSVVIDSKSIEEADKVGPSPIHNTGSERGLPGDSLLVSLFSHWQG